MKKSQLKSLIKEAISEILKESESETEQVSGTISIILIEPQKFSKVIPLKGNYVKVEFGGRTLTGIKYNNLIALRFTDKLKSLIDPSMVNERVLDYDYTGNLSVSYRPDNNTHPYGMGTAVEKGTEKNMEGIEDLVLAPEPPTEIEAFVYKIAENDALDA
jgi:hypothetical protein